MPALMRLWPQRLAGQMIALLVLALIFAQVVTFFIFADERRLALRSADHVQLLGRTVSIVRLLENSPANIHPQILAAASSPRLRYWISKESAVGHDQDGYAGHRLRARLAEMLEESTNREVLVALDDQDHIWSGWRMRLGEENKRNLGWHKRASLGILISTKLGDGRWLNVENRARTIRMTWALPLLTWLGVMAVTLSVVVILMVRRITRPMAALAFAAERIGRGEAIEPLPEIGPLDIRQTTHAFNQMHSRLQRFVQDRTQMLAAMSHDLRTPITTLRLRAEFIEEDEIRVKMLETLEEMQRMAEATLAFAREEAAVEDTRLVDLAALIESVTADMVDLGHEIAFTEAPKTPFACRPTGIKRVLRNLVENAIRYGYRARVKLEIEDSDVLIIVDDDGPGIPEQEIERMFQPFVRLERSRSFETGGIGLGLAIARSIVHRHGGEIELSNREDGGLRAKVRLARQPADAASAGERNSS